MDKTPKLYWPLDSQTKEVLNPVKASFRGGIYHIPQNALQIEPLPDREGFAVVATLNESGIAIGSEYVENFRGKTIYRKSNCLELEVVNKLGPIKQGWTLDKPATDCDVWQGEKWVTDQQAKYEKEKSQVDATRVQLYNQHVDPKLAEARIKQLMAKDAEAAELEQQALAERERIQTENPWPPQPV